MSSLSNNSTASELSHNVFPKEPRVKCRTYSELWGKAPSKTILHKVW